MTAAAGSVSAGSSADQPAPESGELANGRTVPDADRQVVTTGSVQVSVSRPRQVAQQLSAWVETIGGRVDDRSETGSGDDAAADLTIRVPSGQVTATVDQLARYGTVEDVPVQNADVTAAAKDLDARIDALQLSIDRLERILTEAGSSGDVIKAEKALTQRQEQLESLQAQRKATADQVSLSTLSISLTQTARVDTVEPGGFGGGLRGGWNALVSTIDVVVEITGRLLPWAVVATVLLGTGRLVRNRTRRRSPSS